MRRDRLKRSSATGSGSDANGKDSTIEITSPSYYQLLMGHPDHQHAV
jgi:hypothetical protein